MTETFHPAPNPSIAEAQAAPAPGRAHVLVIGNEKGGSGKSTTALHIAVALLAQRRRGVPRHRGLDQESSVSFQPAANPSIVQSQTAREPGRAHVLVIGNEKGGSGKSTTAMHIAVALMSDGARVATIDLDARQGTLTRYIENRAAYARRKAIDLAMPSHAAVAASGDAADEKVRFEAALEPAVGQTDYVVIDTPGSDTHLSRLAHTWADTLLTPLNDSFIDLDLLALSLIHI